MNGSPPPPLAVFAGGRGRWLPSPLTSIIDVDDDDDRWPLVPGGVGHGPGDRAVAAAVSLAFILRLLLLVIVMMIRRLPAGEEGVPLLTRKSVAAAADVLGSNTKECFRSRAAGAVDTSVVMSAVRCPLCDGGRPRRRAGSPPRQKKKSRAWCCCWLVGWLSLVTKLCPYHPKVIEAHRGSHPPDQQVDNYL